MTVAIIVEGNHRLPPRNPFRVDSGSPGSGSVHGHCCAAAESSDLS